MTRIESDAVTVSKTSQEIYTFLSDFNNFQQLMPEQVTNWKSTSEECSFTINGMATLGMRIVEKTPHSMIKAAKHGTAPFDFTLTCLMDDKGSETQVRLVFDADLNPMLRMMAQTPLTNFLNLLVQRLKAL